MRTPREAMNMLVYTSTICERNSLEVHCYRGARGTTETEFLRNPFLFQTNLIWLVFVIIHSSFHSPWPRPADRKSSPIQRG